MVLYIVSTNDVIKSPDDIVLISHCKSCIRRFLCQKPREKFIVFKCEMVEAPNL